MIRFIVVFLIWVALIALPPVAMHFTHYGQLLTPNFEAMFVFFAVVTGMVCTSALIGQRKSSTVGVQVFLSATVIKLLACMVFAVVYLLNYAVNGVIFMASFFYLYFCFTVFEIYSLLSNLRVQNEKEKSR